MKSSRTGTMRWQLRADHIPPVRASLERIAARTTIANHDGRFEQGRAVYEFRRDKTALTLKTGFVPACGVRFVPIGPRTADP